MGLCLLYHNHYKYKYVYTCFDNLEPYRHQDAKCSQLLHNILYVRGPSLLCALCTISMAPKLLKQNNLHVHKTYT